MAFYASLLRPASGNVLFRRSFAKMVMEPIQRTPTFTTPVLIKKATLFGQTLPLTKATRKFNTSKVMFQEEKAHDHAKLWVIEKATSALMVVLIPCGLLIPNKLFDVILAVLITAHGYWGMEAIMVEYIRVLLFGPMIPKIAMGVVYGMTALMLGGLFFLIFNDIGLCRAFWRIWRNMRQPADYKTKSC